MFPDINVGEDFEFMMTLKKRSSAHVVVVDEEEGICSHTYHPHLNVSGGERQNNKPIGREVPTPQMLAPLLKTLLEIDPVPIVEHCRAPKVAEEPQMRVQPHLAAYAVARPRPPTPPPVEVKTNTEEEPPHNGIWIVVGGGDKGGLLVRKEISLGSEAFDERLSTGAVIQEMELEGERLHFQKLIGNGPVEGWISISLDHKVLAQRYMKAGCTAG